MARSDPDDMVTVVGAWAKSGGPVPNPVGSRMVVGGRNVVTQAIRTGRPMRIDRYDADAGSAPASALPAGMRAAAGVPIVVERQVWGVMILSFTRVEPPPADTEARLAGFTELVATAVANAQARVEVRGFAEEQAAQRRVATFVAQGGPPEEVFAAVRRGRAGTRLRLYVHEPLRLRRHGHHRRLVGASRHSGARSPRTAAAARRAQPAHARSPQPPAGPVGQLRPGRRRGPGRRPGRRHALGGGRADRGRRPAVGVDDRRVPGGAAAGRHRGAAGRVHRAGRHRGGQCRGPGAAERLAGADRSHRRRHPPADRTKPPRRRSAAPRLPGSGAAHSAGRASRTRRAGLPARSVANGLGGALDELREIARGLHAAVLADGGLSSALKTLGRRSAVPVRLDVRLHRRLSDPVELAAYYTVAEALTNAAKHAQATVVDVEVDTGDGHLRIQVHDDGRGGADLLGGSGLLGLKDRAEALGGRITLDSPPGAGTTLHIALPLHAPEVPGAPREDVRAG